MEKLNPCGSKAGEYVGKPVLSAPTPGVSWAAFPSSFRICLTSLSGGWRGEVLPSCGHAGGGGGKILGLNAGCLVLLEEPADMASLRVPKRR